MAEEELVTLAEHQVLIAAGWDPIDAETELLVRFIERWGTSMGQPVVEGIVQRRVRALSVPLRSTLKKAVYEFYNPDSATLTKLMLLELGVVPEEPYGSDPDVVPARADTCDHDDESELDYRASIIIGGAISAYGPWYPWSAAEIELRLGGPGRVKRILRKLPRMLFERIQALDDNYFLAWLYHYGVVTLPPPDYEVPWHAPRDYEPPQP